MLLDVLTTYINKATAQHHMDIIIAGDTNLPGIHWDDLTTSNSDYLAKSLLLGFMADNLLSQYVNVPTRKGNTLDVLLTNNSNLTLHSSAVRPRLSYSVDQTVN